MNFQRLTGELKRIEALLAIALSRHGTPGTTGTNATQNFASGGLGPLQVITFDAGAPYVPLTTGKALLVGNYGGTVSNAGDTVNLALRVGGVPVSGGSAATAGVDTAGSLSFVVPIVLGVPITPGIQAGNDTIGHTCSCLPGGLNVSIIELQTT